MNAKAICHDRMPGGIAWHALPIGAIATLCVTDMETGLSDDEVASRQNLLHKNTVHFSSLTWRFAARRLHGLLLVGLAILFSVEVLAAAWPGSLALLALMLAVLVATILQARKARQARAALRTLKKRPAQALRNGAFVRIPASELVPGDIIRIEAGDVVPADGRLFRAEALRCRQTPLPPHSCPLGKCIEPVSTDAALSARTDMIYMGSQVESGSGLAIVVATGNQTLMSKLANLEEEFARILPLGRHPKKLVAA